VVGEHERGEVSRASGQSSATLPGGMREVRINYHELEAEG